MDPSNSPSKMTDTERLHQIIDIIFKSPDGDWNETVETVYGWVRDTDYYEQLEERKKVYEQQRKIKELKNKQKRAEEEAQRLMIELQELEEKLK